MNPEKNQTCMNLHKGEIWTCETPYCGAEIEVVRSAKDNCPGNFTVRCCCGKEMKLTKPAAAKEIPEAVAAGAGTK